MRILYLSLFFFVGGSLLAQPFKGFHFVESSTGMNYPSWDSGQTELEFADINMDGYVDILSIGDHGCPNIGAQEHGIMVWFGNGTGSWSAQMTGNFGYGGIAIGDVNNDGFWDVGMGMHHNYASSDLGNQLLEVALGDGSGTNWIAWDDGLATHGEDWGMFGTDFADVDNDGDLDIGSNSFGSGDGVHVYLNQGDGTWVQSFGFLAGNSNMQFVFGDINNDGNVDFVLPHDGGIAYFGDGAGNFTDGDFNLPVYSFPMSGPDLGDVNNDGADDLAYVNPAGGIMVWSFNAEALQWINYSGTLPSTGSYQEVQMADFNGDQIMDLAAFGNAHLTVWSGALEGDRSITWSQEFALTTSNNGDCAAFRTGGDVDRNGFPDMTLVEKVGNWPNDKNHLKCFKESTPFSSLSIRAVFPKGNEVLRQGSVGFTDWISAVPVTSAALVQIDYSLQGRQGPWTSLTAGTANSGRYQWIPPQTISSNNCFLKYTLIEAGDTIMAMNPEPFIIYGEEGLEADFMADSTQVYPGSQVHFNDLSLGLVTSWEWDFNNDGTVDATVRNPAYVYSEPGTYTVKLTVSDENTSQTVIKTDYIIVMPHVTVMEREEGLEWRLFPNPCTDKITVRYKENGDGKNSIEKKVHGRIQLDLYEVSGLHVKALLNEEAPFPVFEKELDIRYLPEGIYIYKLQTGDWIKMGKICKMK